MESDAVAAVSAESQKRKREEYEMQLFGFHSRAVYATQSHSSSDWDAFDEFFATVGNENATLIGEDAVKSIVMEGIQSRSRKLCETLEKVHKTDAANLAMLKANEERLVKAYNTAAAPYLKNLENIVNKFIAVPNNVLADEDKIQEIQYTEAEFENIRGKLEELQQRARRAAVLNASLNEELQLIEQFSICADNTDRLSHIIESSIKCPDVSDKIHQLVEYYKRFSAFLDDGVPVSEKSIYNAIDDLKCIDCNMDAL